MIRQLASACTRHASLAAQSLRVPQFTFSLLSVGLSQQQGLMPSPNTLALQNLRELMLKCRQESECALDLSECVLTLSGLSELLSKQITKCQDAHGRPVLLLYPNVT